MAHDADLHEPTERDREIRGCATGMLIALVVCVPFWAMVALLAYWFVTA